MLVVGTVDNTKKHVGFIFTFQYMPLAVAWDDLNDEEAMSIDTHPIIVNFCAQHAFCNKVYHISNAIVLCKLPLFVNYK